MTAAQRHLTPHALVRLLGDWQDGPGPLYVRLSRRLGQLLADGRVAPGVRLPSERALAERLRLSRTTIARAYAVLRRQGALESRRGAGSVTRLAHGSEERFVAWAGATRFESRSVPIIDLTKAAPPAGARVSAALREAAAGMELGGHDGYLPFGLRELRAAIAARYDARGVPTTPEQIMVTAGAQQAIDLLARTLVRTRETVVCESPTYPGAMDSFRFAGARLVALDISADPWDVDEFETLVAETGARLAYLIPDFQNPTGRLMPDEARARLVDVARRQGVTLVVDETLAEVVIEAGPDPRPVAGHDASSAVISVGSLSKVVWGGLRTGWIRASPRQLAAIAATRTVADLGGAIVEQIAAAALLADMDALRAERRAPLLRRRDALVRVLRERLGWQVAPPRGGLSAWVELPAGSSSFLADVAYRRGVALIPGPRFSPDGVLDRYLRLPYSLPSETLASAIDRLADAWSEAQEGEPRAARSLQVV